MGESIHVLHVDDEPDFADMTATFLEREDDRLTITTITNPKEAIKQLSRQEFDCIVSDFDMPSMDGIEFLETVHEDYTDLPFILFTGKGSEEVASDAISVGATDYLQKGGGTDQYELLVNRIQNAVEQYRNKQRRETLERIRALVNDVNQALVHASSRQQIETQVCDILADAAIYRFAVVAEVAEDTKQIRPSTWAGKGEAFLDEFEMSVAEDSPGRRAPGGRAFHEREIAIAQDIQSDPTYEEWSELALDHGFQAIAVIPLEHNSEFYGLLAVLADRPYAFDETEQQVLTELGDDIAHALASIEDRDKLHSKKGEKEDDEKLGEYREYTERMLNTMDDLFFVLDKEGNLLRWNDAFTEVTGYSDEEIVSMTGIEFIQDEHREPVATAIERVFETGHARVEASLLTKSDETVPYEYAADRVKHPDGDPRLVGVGRDISERKRREQELEQYETIIQTIDDGVYVVDEAGRFVMVNDAYVEMFGYDREELLGAPTSLIGGEDVSEEAQHLDNAMRRGSVDTPTIEADLPAADGDQFSAEAKFALLSGSADQEYRVGVVRDISQRKAREQKLQRQNEQLSEFANVVSHDLRNPLGVANGQLVLAQAECDSEHIEHAQHALDRMDALIGDLLTLAREGEAVSDFEPVNLSILTEDCWETVETADATLVTETAHTVYADENRLKQLLENLVSNAVEHGGDNVTITVGDLDNGFYLEDDGPGIPENEYDKVFDAGHSTRDEGTGFGLSIVDQVVEAHDWEINLTEGSEGGAKFEITDVEDAAE